jgi:hypothetical protein
MTYSGLTAGAGATAAFWVDGIITDLYVTSVRHYGYEFDTSVYRTVDAYITEATEATVAAYTAIGVSGSTVTISANCTWQQVYDYLRYYLCTHQTVSEFYTAAGSVTDPLYTSTYNFVINTGVTVSGIGSLTLSGGATLTMTGTAQSSIDITHTSGTAVWTRVSLTGLTANSRVQLYDTNTSTELYNAVVAGTTVEYQQNWTADHSIRYRISYVNGTTAKSFLEATATFASGGLSVGISQTDDAVYIANNVDGSTITGITITPSPARVKINLAGGTIPWKDIYAYQCYWLYGATGIADEAAFITATDTANYSLTGFDIRNDSAIPLTLTGGWGKDSVTDTIAGVIDVAGSTGNIYAEPDHIIPSSGMEEVLVNTRLIPALL